MKAASMKQNMEVLGMEVSYMSVFKSYLRQLIRQLKALKKANEEGNSAEVKRIIDELLKDAQDGLEDD